MSIFESHVLDLLVGIVILVLVSLVDYTWFFFSRGNRRKFNQMAYTITGFGVGWIFIVVTAFVAFSDDSFWHWVISILVLAVLSSFANRLTYRRIWGHFLSRRYHKILYRIAAIWAELLHREG